MVLRIQRERQGAAFFPSLREYAVHYGLNLKRLGGAHADAIVMHPGPMNRGIEIASDVADGTRSLILDQVSNGLAVRMAVLYLLAGGSVLNQHMLAQSKPEAATATDKNAATNNATRSGVTEQLEPVTAGQTRSQGKRRGHSTNTTDY
jgi:aspartate carbamoyltransferase catalytic subunit